MTNSRELAQQMLEVSGQGIDQATAHILKGGSSTDPEYVAVDKTIDQSIAIAAVYAQLTIADAIDNLTAAVKKNRISGQVTNEWTTRD